jgi:protein-S-isoprenylcysteine O-methyltransferase Ste14
LKVNLKEPKLMLDVVVSGAISLLMVLVETVGIAVAKWAVVRRQTESRVATAMAEAADSFVGTSGRMAFISSAGAKAREEVRKELVLNVIPGPEFSFMALTFLVTLFLSYFYATEALRKTISPFLAGSSSNYPILFGAILVSLIIWFFLFFWREMVVSSETGRHRKKCISAILAIGVVNLTAALYLIIAGRV